MCRVGGNCCAGIRCDKPGCSSCICLCEHAEKVPDCLNLMLFMFCELMFDFEDFMMVKRSLSVVCFFVFSMKYYHAVFGYNMFNILILASWG